ncbi:acetolactate synthase AlsS [Granulicella sibirica]|uniref:Acetolactate synthase, catabolic n=1 Tax=Granulicella sibirica TaxID=2479048 RepID=A0A4Q0T7M6_9BACT|nr:acetolactate synthase AlsS [Granulicella sibirica]RXH58118.1 Acetolactate synthase, catabolic [Granulicella sibirica]
MSQESAAPQKAKIGAEVVVEALERRGVKWIFGVPGAKIDSVFNALKDSAIQTVVCRHEQNAAFIAGGIGRMTGRAGVAIATSGPGSSNLVTGLATANTEGDPIVALGGAVGLEDRLKKIHQTLDSVNLCKPVTKYSVEVDSPRAVAEVMENAFRAAEGGRPGASFVSLPTDVMAAPAACEVLEPSLAPRLGAADAAAIQEAARLINKAKKPIVLLGMLASKVSNVDAIRRLLLDGKLPVVGTFQAAGAVSLTEFPNFAGRVWQTNNLPGDMALAHADLVVTIGYDPVEYWPSIWNRGKARPIIHIDVEGADIDNSYRPSVELVGDVGATVAALTPLIKHSGPDLEMSNLLVEIAREREEMARISAAKNGTPIHPLRIVNELQSLLSPDMSLCLDMGSFHLWIARNLHSFRARQILISNGQQTLGVALPWAIAATLVRPADKVVSISGDGGFMFSAMELETAVRLQSHLVHMVWIDGTYDMVATQERVKYGRASGIEFGPVDPVKYAEAFGATGMMIRSPDEIRPVMKQALDASGPVIVGIHVDYRDNHTLFESVDTRAIH